MFSACPSVRLLDCYQTCEYSILKTNELIWMQIGTSGLQGKYFGGQEVRGQGHRRPKLDLEAWWRWTHFGRLGSLV